MQGFDWEPDEISFSPHQSSPRTARSSKHGMAWLGDAGSVPLRSGCRAPSPLRAVILAIIRRGWEDLERMLRSPTPCVWNGLGKIAKGRVDGKVPRRDWFFNLFREPVLVRVGSVRIRSSGTRRKGWIWLDLQPRGAEGITESRVFQLVAPDVER